METVYTVRSKNSQNIWEFKYDLNGFLISYNVLEGTLSEKQFHWLHQLGNFPVTEQKINEWQKKLKVNFEIDVGEPDLSFDAIWELYNYKYKKFEAEKRWNKLSKADKLKCFKSIKGYDAYLARKGTAKALLATFINQRYFDDDWSKVY